MLARPKFGSTVESVSIMNSVLGWLKKVSKSKPIIGVAAILAIPLAIAIPILQELRNSYDFDIELIEEINLVEVREVIGDLKVLYKEEDILANQKAMKVVWIALRNPAKTIGEGQYASHGPFGLRFANSEILGAEVVSAGSKYLQDNLIKEFKSDKESGYSDLILEKLIYDKDDYAVVKVTLLQMQNGEVDVSSFGKLADIGDLEVVRAKTKEGVDWRAYAVVAVFIVVVVVVVVAYVGFALSAYSALVLYLSKRGKMKGVSKFKDESGPLTKAEEDIVDAYLGMDAISDMMARNLLEGNHVVDLANVQINFSGIGGLAYWLAIPEHFTRRYWIPPEEVFAIDGTTVTFSRDNESFIKGFLGEVLR